jgi:hypothetical protein
MAVNINIGTSRQEGRAPENFNETTEQNSEQDLSAQPQLSEQSGQSSSGQSTDGQTAPPPEPATLADQDSIPPPAYMRYGIGDTVIMGAPSYVRDYAQAPQLRAENASIESPSPAPTAPASPAMFSIAMPSVSVGTIANVVNSIDDAATESITPDCFAASEPMTPLATNASAALIASTVTTSAKPIPMPKPGSTFAPGASSSLPAPATSFSPTVTNAPRIAGQAVRQALAEDQSSSQASAATGIAPTASAAELESIDAMLADPINRQLIDVAKQNMGPAPTNNAVADAQIKQYGEARFQDMMYLHRALPWVQDAYAQAVKEAYLANTQPALTANLTNNQGIATPPSTFDINAFTKEYANRSDLMAQAFAAKFGGVPVTQEAGFSGTVSSGDGGGDRSGAYVPVFNVGNLFSVSMNAVFPTGYADGQEGSPPNYFASRTPNTMQQYVLGSDIGDHRAMFDDTAVWFDPSLGFVTDPQNLKDDEESHFDRVMGVVGPIVLTGILAAAGAEFLIGPQGSAVLGFTADSWQAGAIRGGVQAGVATVANSAVTGRTLTLADLGRSIFTGGVMGGLVNYANLDTYGITTQNGVQVVNWGERLTAILGRGTMQGILQQVTGGRFQDGLRNGLISSVSNELSRNLNTEINRWAAENNVDPFVASQLRMVGQGFTSALVRTAANGGEGGVEAFLSDLINGQIGAAGDAERAEINQLTTQYNVAVATNDYTTQATILNDLTERWMNNHPTDSRAQALAQVTAGLGWTVDAVHLTQEGNGRLEAIENISTEARQILASADADLDSLDNGINENIFGTQVAAGNGNATDAQSPLNIVNNPLLSLAQRLNLVERDLNVIDGRITEFTRLEAEARASGNTSLANRYQDRVNEFLSRQSQYREAYQMLGTARTAQSFSESLYSNDRGYSREQIDAAMNRILRRELPVGGADEFVRNQMVGNNPGLWASLNDPEGLALIAAAGSIGRALTRGTPSMSNYRDLFRANRPDMPANYQVHHSIPQKYADRMAAEGVNIHEVQYLRGIDRDTHTRITALWETFGRQNNGNPSIAQIQNFARQIDQQFGGKFVWPK